MVLYELITEYVKLKSIMKEAIDFSIEKLIINEEISPNISEFIKKLNAQETLTDSDFMSFNNELVTIKIKNIDLYNAVVGIVRNVCLQVFDSYQNEINQTVTEIENRLNSGSEFSFPLEDKPDRFNGLLNIYRLTKDGSFHRNEFDMHPFLLILRPDIIKYDVPFAINTLILTNKLPKGIPYCGLDLSQPLYPRTLKVQEKKVQLKRGIEESDSYFPYKRASTLALGGMMGGDIFLATNGKKNLYVTDIEHYSPDAILASKIATFVSKEHFYSVNLLSNGLAASRKPSQDSVYAADASTMVNRKNFIETDKKVFPGTGIVDEVSNFVNDTNFLVENFRFSSSDIQEAYISKINFNECSLRGLIKKEEYEKDVLSKDKRSIYHGSKHVGENEKYIDEKLHTRLKLSIMSETFMTALAKKACIDPKDQKDVVDELLKRSDIAFDIFLDNKNSKKFLNGNRNLLNDILQNSILYIHDHFDEDERQNIIQSIIERAQVANDKIKNKLGVILTPLKNTDEFMITPFPPKGEILPVKKIMVEDSNIISEEKFNSIVNELDKYIKNRTSVFSNVFMDKKLTLYKRLLAESVKDNLQNLNPKDRESILNFTNAMKLLNSVIEELSDQKSPGYKGNKMTNEDIKEFFKKIVEIFPSMLTVENLDITFVNMGYNQQYVKFKEVIFAKLNEFVNRDQNKRFGKKYCPSFSSGLACVASNIDKIITEDHPKPSRRLK